MDSNLTPDTQTLLLLCGELGQRNRDGQKPLGLRQYNTLVTWLKSEGLRPGELLTSGGRERLGGFQSSEADFDRITRLLDRGAALALVAERWERSGLWVISRSDACYPERLKRYLGQSAPPLLYGVGSKDLLNRGGLAIVGSRDRSEDDGNFARCVGERCAQEGIAVISGAAKGIDRDAMSGVLEAGGWALGVLAEGLAKPATSGQFREGLESYHLALVSPYDPDSRWFTYAAMERNKLLYGLSDAALVVASSADSGGTWAGATEAIKHGKVKVFVKSGGVPAPGNLKLMSMGGIPFPSQPWGKLQDMITAPEEKNRAPFSETARVTGSPAESIAETPGSRVLENSPQGQAPSEPVPSAQGEAIEKQSCQSEEGLPAHDAYSLVIDTIVALLEKPQADDLLAAKMCVRAVQVKDWLERGVREGRISRLRKPVRYVASVPTLFSK